MAQKLRWSTALLENLSSVSSMYICIQHLSSSQVVTLIIGWVVCGSESSVLYWLMSEREEARLCVCVSAGSLGN